MSVAHNAGGGQQTVRTDRTDRTQGEGYEGDSEGLIDPTGKTIIAALKEQLDAFEFDEQAPQEHEQIPGQLDLDDEELAKLDDEELLQVALEAWPIAERDDE